MSDTSDKAISHLRQLYSEHFDSDKSPELSAFILASAPGRVELAGNHTDHQGGHTISAAISQRAYALAAPNNSDEIRVFMNGFGKVTISCLDLDAKIDERETSSALIRGMLNAYAKTKKPLKGFNMVTCSDIPVGSGVSSSAAYEVLLGTVIRAICDEEDAAGFFNESGSKNYNELTALALDGMHTECDYFKKPCGAQDQLASAFGGTVALDFSNDTPYVIPINFDASISGYTMLLIDSKCDHSNYTDDFASIPADMHTVAKYFNCNKLAEVPYPNFLEQLRPMREILGDRAALRALHFFEEDKRVLAQKAALETNDFERFLKHVRLSGASSAQYLQNTSTHADTLRAEQPVMVILALCAHLLDGVCQVNVCHEDAKLDTSNDNRISDNVHKGAYRVHGGGFGGGVLAFVPNEDADSFISAMNKMLGYDACTTLSISSQGAIAIRLI